MHGDKVQKGKFRVQNVTKKLLAYRIRVSQKDNLVSWEVKNGAAVLKPGQSRQVSVFMPPGNHIEDLVHVHVFQGEPIRLWELLTVTTAELRQELRKDTPSHDEQLTLRKASIEEHKSEAEKHAYKQLFKCSQCQKPFKYLRSLNNHIRTDHLKETTFKCEVKYCTYKGGATSSALRKHIKRIHETDQEELKEKCQDCNKSFTTKTLLKLHKEANHVITKCRVEWCPLEFESRKDEVKHFAKQHSRDQGKERFKEHQAPDPCQICGKVLQTKRGMRKHVKLHNTLDINLGAEVTVGEEPNPDPINKDGERGVLDGGTVSFKHNLTIIGVLYKTWYLVIMHGI